jgi:hypothetical protein
LRQISLYAGEAAVSRKTVIWTIVAVAGAIVAATLFVRMHDWRPKSMEIQGATIRRDQDTRKELPIADVKVTASDGVTSASTQSDASGYYKLTFPGVVWPGRIVNLNFRHADYKPLDLKVQGSLRLAARQLYVAAMIPIPQQSETEPDQPQSLVTNIRVRYTVNAESEENIGSAVKTFEVVNKGNTACNRQPPCSPDGDWKASKSSVSLDAESGNEFRNVRASCIAGPCPFTRIDSSGFVNGGRTITVSAVDWSDTATFLLEAEVFQATNRSNVRELYPVVFGRALNFTLPRTQEGVSIEAEVDGTPMVFPLGPDLYLSWPTCSGRTDIEKGETATVYRCELKPGYQF